MPDIEILDGPEYPSISVSHLIDSYPEELKPYIKRRRLDGKIAEYGYGKRSEHRFVVDGRSVQAQRAITEVTMREYFAAPQYKLSEDNLCPRITNRLLYLKIVEQCLIEGVEVAKLAFKDHQAKTRSILDIGTGASLVYPILSTMTCVKNRVLASECNPSSLEYARLQILPSLDSKDRINLLEVSDHHTVFPEEAILKLIPQGESLLYTVCNPPFYQDIGDLESRNASKETTQHDELKAADSELYYEDGGEVGFLKAYVSQSRHAADSHPCFRETWFTCQVGILKDVEEIKRYCEGRIHLIVLPIPLNTRRWIVAWNFNASMGAHLLGSRAPKPFISSMVRLLREKLNEIVSKHSKFDYRMIEAVSGNVYLAVNEAIWLRKVRRSIKTNEANLFDKRIVLVLNSSAGAQTQNPRPLTVINSTGFDLVTISNGLASLMGIT